MCKIPAMRAGIARQKQAQAFIDAIRRCFDAGQSGAIGAEPYAFILVFAEAVGVVIDVPFAPPPWPSEGRDGGLWY